MFKNCFGGGELASIPPQPRAVVEWFPLCSNRPVFSVQSLIQDISLNLKNGKFRQKLHFVYYGEFAHGLGYLLVSCSDYQIIIKPWQLAAALQHPHAGCQSAPSCVAINNELIFNANEAGTL
jgi:hypothetical protein